MKPEVCGIQRSSEKHKGILWKTREKNRSEYSITRCKHLVCCSAGAYKTIEREREREVKGAKEVQVLVFDHANVTLDECQCCQGTPSLWRFWSTLVDAYGIAGISFSTSNELWRLDCPPPSVSEAMEQRSISDLVVKWLVQYLSGLQGYLRP